MIFARLLKLAHDADAAGQAAVAGRDGTSSYSELAVEAERLAAELRPLAGRAVGVDLAALPRFLAALAALDEIGATAVLLSRSLMPDEVARFAAELPLKAVLSDREGAVAECRAADKSAPAAAPSGSAFGQQSGVVLFTSGTSGPPKPALHRWPALAASVRGGRQFVGRRWLLTYDPTKFAGLQVILQAILTGGTLALPESLEPDAVARCLVEHHVEYASGTPTFWRMLLHNLSQADRERCQLAQITLGGEPADQPLLDALHAAFPAARITHIYASTEMGVCFSISDGREGFPRNLLEAPPPRCRLRIADDGELLIQSQVAMVGRGDEAWDAHAWFATGDLVAERGDRVVFVGRKSDAIHVGGNKVMPQAVEQVIRSVAGVADVRVFGLSSSLVGQLVAAEVVPAAGVQVEVLRQEIMDRCRERLARHQVPRELQFVERLSITAAGKTRRTSDA